MGITHLQLNELTDHKESTLLRLVDERIEIIKQESSIVRKFEKKELKPKDTNKHAAILITYLNLVTIKSYLTEDKEKYKNLLGKDVYEIIYFIFFDYVANLIIDFLETKTVVRKRYLPSSKTNTKERLVDSITQYHFRLEDTFNLSPIINLDNAVDLSDNSHKFYLLFKLHFLFSFYREPLIDEFLEGTYFFQSNELSNSSLMLGIDLDDPDMDMMEQNYLNKILVPTMDNHDTRSKILYNLIKNNTNDSELSLILLSITILQFRNILGISRSKLVDEMASFGSKYTSATWLIRLEEANFKKNEDSNIINQSIDKLVASFFNIAERRPYPSRYNSQRSSTKFKLSDLFLYNHIAFEGLIVPAFIKLKEANDSDLDVTFAKAIRFYEGMIENRKGDLESFMPNLIHFCLKNKNKIKREENDLVITKAISMDTENNELKEIVYNDNHFAYNIYSPDASQKTFPLKPENSKTFHFPTIFSKADETISLLNLDTYFPLKIDRNFFSDGIIEQIDEVSEDLGVMPDYIKVKDDSMSPEINKGDVAIYLQTKMSEDDSLAFNFGDLYVLKNKDIRRIVKPGDLKPDFVIMKATNEEKWPSAELPIKELLGVIGKVIGIIKSV